MYRIGNSYLKLPSDHMLPHYQSSFPCYDRFLPHLATFIPHGSVVIDVGANIGDTVAAMAGANSSLKFHCVEADEKFHKLLLENRQAILSKNPCTTILTYKALAGIALKNVKLSGGSGTKNAVLVQQAEDYSEATPLDDLIPYELYSDVALLKSDVDGFDYDVINSAL